MDHDIELAYLGLEVPDPSSLDTFLSEVIGLLPGEASGADGTRTWRDDDKVHRLLVHPGPAADATSVGFEAVDDDAFDRIAARLRQVGATVVDGSQAEIADRQVRRLVHTQAPWGPRVELVEGLAAAAEPFASPLVPGGFLTDGVGFGHAVFATTAFDESHRFLVDGLGFSQSDWIETEIAEGIPLEVRFYHCNARHHTVALADAPFDLPQTLHHIMLETNDRDDVGAAFDRALGTDLPIPNGLGCHDNDRMFSFYVTSPAGFQVEVGHGARVVTEDWDDNRRYDRVSIWGHQPIRPQAFP
jgi:2,3-dihydroxybiphenyl 1,2-dioxygenase